MSRTRTPHHRPLAGLSAAIALALAPAAKGLETDFSDRWISPDERIELRFDPAQAEGAFGLRVLIGGNDYSGLAQLSGPGVLDIEAGAIGLPSGNSTLVLYAETTDGWRELGRSAIRVRTRAGFEESSITPRLAMTNQSQWAEGTAGDARPPPRPTFHDMAGNFRLETRHTRNAVELASRFSLVGNSVRTQALRFGQRGNDAPKVDLADWRVDLGIGDTEFSAGHLRVGTHPLLINSLSSRGVDMNQPLGERVDLHAAAVAGRQSTGFERLLGVDFDDNRVMLATLGVSPLQQHPDSLRLEFSWMDAERPSRPGFSIGEVADSERSRGAGLRLRARSPGGRVSGEIGWARSRYVNPEDPLLSQGDTLVPVVEESNAAWQASTRLALLQNRQLGGRRANATLNLAFERVDPMYRSLGAFVQPDRQQFSATLATQLDSYSLQFRYSEQEDNLDDIPTVLKTRTRNSGVDFNWPLGSLRSNPETGRSLWPNLSLRLGRTHQYAANEPIPAFSEFDSPSHLPDQVTLQAGVQANWSVGPASVGYSLNFSDQDNRQPGRELADFQSLNHGINVSWNVIDGVSTTVGLSRARNAERERAIARYTDSLNAGVNWRINSRMALSVNWQGGRNHDSLDQAEARNRSLNANLSGGLDLPFPGRRIPAQLFASYSRQSASNLNRIFGFASDQSLWTLNSGLSFEF